MKDVTINIQRGFKTIAPLKVKNSKITHEGVYSRKDAIGWMKMYMHLWSQGSKELGVENEVSTNGNNIEVWVLGALQALSDYHKTIHPNRIRWSEDIIPILESRGNLLKTPISFNKDLKDSDPNHTDEWFENFPKYGSKYFVGRVKIIDHWWSEPGLFNRPMGNVKVAAGKKELQFMNLIWLEGDNQKDPIGIILQPSIMTPSIIWKEEGSSDQPSIEILLLVTNGLKLTEAHVKKQLRFNNGIDTQKKYYKNKIPEQSIKIKHINFDKDGNIKRDPNSEFHGSSFSGILDKRALRPFLLPRKIGKDKFKENIARIRFSVPLEIKSSIDKMLADALIALEKLYQNKSGDAFYRWYKEPSQKEYSVIKDALQLFPFDEFKYSWITIDFLKFIEIAEDSQHIESKPKESESHDFVFEDTLSALNGTAPLLKRPDWGKYCFQLDKNGKDVDIRKENKNRPIQSYHPVFLVPDKHLNIGHITDLHISSRQKILKKSKARVIEINDDSVSGEIGPMVNVCSENIKALLDKFGSDPEIDMVLIGGDIPDFIQSLYIDTEEDENPSIKKIWDKVRVGQNESDNINRYARFTDFIVFYSFAIEFYKKYQKPLYVVSGNHDAYLEPYGLSPTVATNLANEGIPADHNLTIYEARLIFGETYDETAVIENATLQKDNFEWFYSILTPFSEFAIDFPKQKLIGLGWGDDEDLFGGGGGTGLTGSHLPRSDDAISDIQKDFLLKKIKLKEERKKILLTHFTFVSYREDKLFEKGKIILPDLEDTTEFDMGTFETNRVEVFKELLKVQIVLTGHSHRRGLYKLGAIEKKKIIDRSAPIGKISYKYVLGITTEAYDFNKKMKANLRASPNIIVSDSAGPIPRYNGQDEFFGWGSDRASGTKISFDNKGEISKIEAKQVGPVPRFVVALDYQDVVKGDDVITCFETTWGTQSLDEYKIKLILNENILKYVEIEFIDLFYYDNKKFIRIVLSQELTKSQSVLIIKRSLLKLMLNSDECYASIKFKEHSLKYPKYNFDSPWNFEIKVIKHKEDPEMIQTGNHKYEIVREDAIKPDHSWRTQNLKKYK